MKMQTIGIYGLVVKSTGEIYVGQSTDIAKRWSYYSARLKANKHYYKQLQDAYNKDKNNIGWIILEECTEVELEQREDWWIKNANKMDYIVINKEKFAKSKSKVKDVSKMKSAQTGEANGNCRLSVEDVKEIKKALIKGVRNSVLAKEYDVSTTLIYNIKNGNRWASVEV